jgi:hypothetical protein
MNGEEIKLYRFIRGKLICIVASEDYDEAKKLAEVFMDNTVDDILKAYKGTKARVVYFEDWDDMLEADKLLKQMSRLARVISEGGEGALN